MQRLRPARTHAHGQRLTAGCYARPVQERVMLGLERRAAPMLAGQRAPSIGFENIGL